jgi:hypothetical protein
VHACILLVERGPYRGFHRVCIETLPGLHRSPIGVSIRATSGLHRSPIGVYIGASSGLHRSPIGVSIRASSRSSPESHWSPIGVSIGIFIGTAIPGSPGPLCFHSPAFVVFLFSSKDKNEVSILLGYIRENRIPDFVFRRKKEYHERWGGDCDHNARLHVNLSRNYLTVVGNCPMGRVSRSQHRCAL